MVVKITYGERIWEEMGSELTNWNLSAVAMASEAMYTFWPVDIFRFCKLQNHAFLTGSIVLSLNTETNRLQTVRFLPEWTPGVQFK
jgi:hypothetical protein